MKTPGPWSTNQTFNHVHIAYSYGGSGNSPPTRLYGPYRYDYKTIVIRSGVRSGASWRPRLKLGVLPPTAYTLEKAWVDQAPMCDAEYFERSYPAMGPWSKYPLYRGSGAYNVPGITAAGFDAVFGSQTATLQQQALANLYQKIGGTSFDTFTFIGEAKETQTMLRSGINALGKSVLAFEQGQRESLVKRRFKRVSDLIDFATDNWLQYQYGIKPLIGDMENLIDAYSKKENLLNYKLLRAKAEGRWSRTYKVPLQPPQAPVPSGSTYSCTDSRYVTVYCGVRAQTSLFEQGSPNWGLTWNNVLPAAWELVPYSFLIDYFTNVGDIIQAYTAPRAGLTNYWMSTVTEDKRVTHALTWNQKGPHSGWWRGSLTAGTANSFRMVRTVAGAPPLPSLRFSSWDDLSLTKQANVGALCAAFVSRRASSFKFLANLVRPSIF